MLMNHFLGRLIADIANVMEYFWSNILFSIHELSNRHQLCRVFFRFHVSSQTINLRTNL